MNVFEQIKLLHDQELHSSVISLASLVLSVSEHSQDVLSTAAKYQTLVYYGEALYEEAEHHRAEPTFRKALQLYKVIMKSKTKAQKPDVTSEVDVKFRLHQCHVHMKQFQQAIAVLESITAKQRTPKVNMALAKLYRRTGVERSATTGFKEVLRECPLALDAAVALMGLGIRGVEIASLMTPVISHLSSMEWLLSWIRAHAHLASKEFTQAATAFSQLDSKTHLRDNVDVLCSLGEAYYMNGNYKSALTTLERAYSLDPLLLKNMDLLAALLAREKKIKKLEGFANHMMMLTEQAVEPWIAMAHFCMATKKATRAVYFAQKAYTIDSRSMEALLLKGAALLDLRKVSEAILHYREALRINAYRYEAHKGLVECYMASHRGREAITTASATCKQLGQTPRVLTLYASVLDKDPLTRDKAKSCLEKALKQDPYYTEAVCLMADIHASDQQLDKAISLIRMQLVVESSSSRLHQMFGDFLSRNGEHQEALDQFHIALRLDPSNGKAQEGVQKAEKHGDMGDCSYAEVDMDDMAESENDADLEGSDGDAVWSDTDFA
ncbi:PREDICTED: anaphase-promoting complex subunit 7-like [Priapulus caudatus]|uniref:Anaphase-promoting complex subunit 7-like n=1 Tax=Priapulus caudatus TaxID=37621 RepID=A0ABM1DWC4_PRICU|nr:PREDICTED: anaphase-promoting complex subunit 7-like [Priapulus caudatus]